MNRRDALKLVVAGAAGAVSGEAGAAVVNTDPRKASMAKWNVAEIRLQGPAEGNPFVDVQVAAEFTKGARVVRVDGFYDGDGVYFVRWMPDEEGQWQ